MIPTRQVKNHLIAILTAHPCSCHLVEDLLQLDKILRIILTMLDFIDHVQVEVHVLADLSQSQKHL